MAIQISGTSVIDDNKNWVGNYIPVITCITPCSTCTMDYTPVCYIVGNVGPDPSSTISVSSPTGTVSVVNNCIISTPTYGVRCHCTVINGKTYTIPVCVLPAGQIAYTCGGTYTFVAPLGVTCVSVVAVGGGACGANYPGCAGGGGGGLSYAVNIPVTPLCCYTVIVGNNSPSGFYCGATCCPMVVGLGGSGTTGGGGCGLCRTGGGSGGNGGSGSGSWPYGGGGGGAGGYSGNGGDGGSYGNIGCAAPLGGGAGGGSGTLRSGGSGGGVGLYGAGASGGSSTGYGCTGSVGPLFAGGGGSGGYGNGASGGVRIVWGSPGCNLCRAYPSCNVGVDY